MTTTVMFTVYGKPQPKQRPRFSKYSGVVYTPSDTHKYEARVRKAYLDQRSKMITESGAVWAIIKCYFPIPKSATKRRREMMMQGRRRPTTRTSGDADNLAKSILDALNGVAYKDDSQVVSLIVDKLYVTTPDGEAFVDVMLSGIGDYE